MGETNELTSPVGGSENDQLNLDSAWNAVREWASAPATRGFTVGVASAAVVVACALIGRRPSI